MRIKIRKALYMILSTLLILNLLTACSLKNTESESETTITATGEPTSAAMSETIQNEPPMTTLPTGDTDSKQAESTLKETRMLMDVTYAEQSKRQKLDIYWPETGDGPFPVIVALHTGAEQYDKSIQYISNQARGIEKGYAVVSVDYRWSVNHLFPSGLHDAKAAIRFIRAHAEVYHLDPNRIVAWGESSGAILAAMLGTTAGNASLEDLDMGNSDQPSDVQAVVASYGVMNYMTLKQDMEDSSLENNEFESILRRQKLYYLGDFPENIPDIAKVASASSHISAQTAPFMIIHGTDDGIFPVKQSVDFASALEKVIGKDNVVYLQLEGAKHGGREFAEEVVTDQVFAFLDKVLK